MWNWCKSLTFTCGLCRITELFSDVRREDVINGESLYAAIKRGDFEIVKTLLKRGADVNAACESLGSSTFLHVAVINRRYEIAKILIRHGADVNMRHPSFMLSPILYAVRNLDEDMTKLLLSSGADLDDMYDLLSSALQYGHTEMAEILLQHNPKFDINATYRDGRTLLYNVIKSPPLKKITNYDRSLTDCENEDLYKTKLVEFCVSRGVIVDAKTTSGKTALFAAVFRGLANVVEMLLEYGAEVDIEADSRKNKTALIIAVKTGNSIVIQSLMNYLPESEVRDINGRTALHLASQYASPSIVQKLLNYGADINATSKDGTTPYTCLMITYPNSMILEQHVHKMIALDLYVSLKNLQKLNLREAFYNDCKREVEEMKHTKINYSVVSLYDVLTKRMQKLALYTKNKSIMNTLNTMAVYLRIFIPLYFDMLYCRLIRAIKLESLLTASAQSLDSLIGFELPCVVYMELFHYLSIKDLKNLIRSSATTD